MHEKRTVQVSQKSTDIVLARADGPAEIADPAQAANAALMAGPPETPGKRHNATGRWPSRDCRLDAGCRPDTDG